jgi:TolA-binding protein
VTLLGGVSLWSGYKLLSDGTTDQHTSEQHAVPAEVKDIEPITDVTTLGRVPKVDDGQRHPAYDKPGVDESEPGVLNPSRLESVVGDPTESAVRGRKSTTSDSLARELALIEASRAEVLRKNPTAALNTLSKYRKEFPKGTLLAEATVLRVEALIASGNRAAATEVGGAFLKRSPNSPYSRRISSLLSGSRGVGQNSKR